MKEIRNKKFLELKGIDALVLPSNGYVTLEGLAFPADGVAYDASKQWKNYVKYLGHLLSFHGNHVFQITKSNKKDITLGHYKLKYHILHFPIQPSGGIHKGSNVLASFRNSLKEGEPVPGYKLKIDFELLDQAIKELLSLTKARKWEKVVIGLPRVDKNVWKKMRRKMKRKLDNRFILVSEEKK